MMNCNSQITSEPVLGPDYVSQARAVENRVYVQYGDLNPSYGPQHDNRIASYAESMDWKENPASNPLPSCPQGFRNGFCRIYDEYQVRSSANYQFNRCDFQGNVYEQNQVEKPAAVRTGGLPNILNLPCQSSNNWDYNQCYSYYANGCYNTCQFVNVGDMEDFM